LKICKGGGELVFGPVALEDLPDLEQRHVGESAIGILLRRRHEPRNEARPHVGQVGGDRIGERKLRRSAAEQFGLAVADERPGDGLDQSAAAKRALGLAGAHLQRGEHRLARALAALERRERHAVDAEDAHDLLDDVGLALDIAAP
jgi:hypothetical protein